MANDCYMKRIISIVSQRVALCRFTKGGAYFPMVSSQKIKAWVVLDFYGQTSRQPRSYVKDVIYVCFSDDYTSANIVCNDESSFIRVLGKATA